MASTSSSREATLLVQEVGTERVDEFPLLPVGMGGERIDIAAGAVKEDGLYRFAIVVGDRYLSRPSRLVVNGDEDFGPCPVISRDRLGRSGRSPAWSEEREAFSLIYGFARAEVELMGLHGRELLSTRDIPVLVRGDSASEEARPERMYETLFSPERGEALQWMLSGAAREGERFSIVEGSVVERSPRSLSTFIQMTEEVLDGLERELPQMRVRPMQRVSTVSARVDGERVYRLDRDEVLWIATHPDVLERTEAPTGIADGWTHYMPRYVETRRHVRSLDTYENETILSFLSHCANVTGHAGELLASYGEDDARLMGALNRRWDEGYVAAPLTVLRASGSGRERMRASLARLTERALRLGRYYGQAFPGASAHAYRFPRRTKVFQEVPAYMRVYELMDRWESFGDVDLSGNGFALLTPRVDTFYEYYCLYLLLDAMVGLGFEIVRADLVDYEYGNRFHSRSGVANRYELARGGERALLFYEPVAYGYRDSEHGVGLQRVTAAPGQERPVYTPDFLIRHDRGDGLPRDIVLDAKYSRVSDIVGRVRGFNLDGRSVTMTTLTECIVKYKVGCVAAETGQPPVAVWLLCGKDDGDVVQAYGSSPWLEGRRDVCASGAIALGRPTDGLGMLLASLGLGAEAEASGTGAAGRRARAASAGGGASGRTASGNRAPSGSRRDTHGQPSPGRSVRGHQRSRECGGQDQESQWLDAQIARSQRQDAEGAWHQQSDGVRHQQPDLPSSKPQRRDSRAAGSRRSDAQVPLLQRPDAQSPRAPRLDIDFQRARRAEVAPLSGHHPAGATGAVGAGERSGGAGNVAGPTRDDATLIYKALSSRFDLFDVRWAAREIGLRVPFFRRSLDDGATAADYQLTLVDGEALFFRKNLDERQMKKFQALLRRLRR